MTRLLIIDSDCLFARRRKPVPMHAGCIPALVALARLNIRPIMMIRAGDAALWDTWREFLAEEGVEPAEIVFAPAADVRSVAHQLAKHLPAESRSAISLLGNSDESQTVAATLGVSYLDFAVDLSASWQRVPDTVLFPERSVRFSRTTSETAITGVLDVDTGFQADIHTGLAFFDHMLEQIARHSEVGLQLAVTGDLHIDEHHTIEDTAIALGEAFRKAVGEKRGMARYGFYLPMDEAAATVALDFSNRPVLKWDVALKRERVGDFPCEMAEHFFHSFAVAAGLTLHVNARGENDHHVIEAVFKSVGKALKQALERTTTSAGIPSTKGVL